MSICSTPRPLTERSGEELLLMAIAGDTTLRRSITRELNLRALLAEGPRRARQIAAAHPRLRLVGLAERAA
jgi:hypothetical protein